MVRITKDVDGVSIEVNEKPAIRAHDIVTEVGAQRVYARMVEERGGNQTQVTADQFTVGADGTLYIGSSAVNAMRATSDRLKE